MSEKHPLRAIREARDMSMADFADFIGIPKATLQNRERGKLPDVREGLRIARALGVNVESIWPELPDTAQECDETGPEAA